MDLVARHGLALLQFESNGRQRNCTFCNVFDAHAALRFSIAGLIGRPINTGSTNSNLDIQVVAGKREHNAPMAASDAITALHVDF
jgi:hypothetical protein